MRLSSLILFMILAIGCGNLCQCILVDEAQDNKAEEAKRERELKRSEFERKYTERDGVFVVGIDHSRIYEIEYRFELLRLTSQGKIVLGLEGFWEEDPEISNKIKHKYNLEKGHIYGFEDELPINFSLILAGYFTFASNLYEYDAKVNFMATPIRFAGAEGCVGKIWNSLDGRPLPDEAGDLYDRINERVARLWRNKDLLYKKADLERMGPLQAWEDLYRELAIAMADEVREKYSDNDIDWNVVDRLFEEPLTKSIVDKAKFEIIGNWRDQVSIKKNVLKIANFGISERKPVYIFIGYHHGSSVYRYLKAYLNGVNVFLFDGSRGLEDYLGKEETG